ncbi:cytochrome c550 [Litchfieldia salsa]|uniref:Cytochrome c550 n=1 Tax=Litchfieldia salsa TaxID=930152 RepID=A0A1H0VB03_9BACI|nr:cytochrome c [Litchfieldia salsa]SDP75415.1 cytochrome c550 [Litchfieldia salsa]
MNRNPLIPFGLIFVFGIGLMFLLSFIGLGNMDELANEGEETPEATVAASPEEIYQGKCAACHGVDMSGGVGPDLHGVGERYEADEIKTILEEGKGIMQGGLVPAEHLDDMVTWLSEL